MPGLVGAALGLLLLAGCGHEDPSAASSQEGATTLLGIAERGDVSALTALLTDRRVPPDVRDACQWTPLMKAALNGHLAVVEGLVAAGAAIDAEDSGGYTAMMLAASNDHAAIVDYLLGQGAEIDHREATQGLTALTWATKLGHRETVETLLRHGADATLVDFSEHTAAQWATERGFAELGERLHAAEGHPRR